MYTIPYESDCIDCNAAIKSNKRSGRSTGDEPVPAPVDAPPVIWYNKGRKPGLAADCEVGE